jgi:anti-sigma regulatory factor (Ser/Thr protein kinase)/DNA-binding CsgD family transcriptional regulator
MIEKPAVALSRERIEFVRQLWPAQPRQLAQIRVEVRRWLASIGLTGETQEDVLLAVNEAASNSVDHAYPAATADDTVELIFWTEPDAVCIEIIDQGAWHTPAAKSERGRGIAMMGRLMDSVLIHHGLTGTRVLLQCRLPEDPVGSELATRLNRARGHGRIPIAISLTSAEIRVLQLLPTHLSLDEIGEKLSVSRNTVKTHVAAVYRKLDASTRTEAVQRGREYALLERSPSARAQRR